MGSENCCGLIIITCLKTNKYKMSLLDIVGVTATNMTFYVGFGFMSDEKSLSSEFILRSLYSVIEQMDIPFPRTAFTDKDDDLMAMFILVGLICVIHK